MAYFADVQKSIKLNSLWQSLRSIAGMCNGASSEDGRGFNKIDTGTGKDLAQEPVMNWYEICVMMNLVNKYKGQLSEVAIFPKNELWEDFKGISECVQYKSDLGKKTNTPFIATPIVEGVFITIDAKKNFVITFTFKSKDMWTEVKNEIASFQKRRFDMNSKSWIITLNADDSKEVSKFIAFTVKYKAVLTDSANQMVKTYNAPILEKNDFNFDDYKNSSIVKKMFPFQVEGFKRIMEEKVILLADDMGLGKTIQSLGVLISTRKFPALIVVPANLRYNWKKEIYKHCDNVDFSVNVINTSKARKKTYCVDFTSDVVIINYDLVSKFEKELSAINWQTIIMDESHYIKNPKAKRTMALIKIANNNNPEYIILASGTPIMNKPVELISQLKVLNKVEAVSKNEWAFKQSFCGAERTKFGWTFDGATNTKELAAKLKRFMIRRTKTEVLTDLPERIIEETFIEIDNWKEYETAENEFALMVEKELIQLCKVFLEQLGEKSTGNVLDYMKTNYEADYVRFVKGVSNSAIHLSRIEGLKQIAVNGKLAQAKEFIDDVLETGEKLVVFADHVFTQDKLAEMFPDALKIGSETAGDRRQEIVDEFQNNPEQKLIILSMKSCAEGITLTSASKMLVLEYLWNGARMNQCYDRIHRIGQKNACMIYNMIAMDTIESENIYPLIMKKMDMTAEILDGKNSSSENTMFSFLSDFLNKKKQLVKA